MAHHIRLERRPGRANCPTAPRAHCDSADRSALASASSGGSSAPRHRRRAAAVRSRAGPDVPAAARSIKRHRASALSHAASHHLRRRLALSRAPPGVARPLRILPQERSAQPARIADSISRLRRLAAENDPRFHARAARVLADGLRTRAGARLANGSPASRRADLRGENGIAPGFACHHRRLETAQSGGRRYAVHDHGRSIHGVAARLQRTGRHCHRWDQQRAPAFGNHGLARLFLEHDSDSRRLHQRPSIYRTPRPRPHRHRWRALARRSSFRVARARIRAAARSRSRTARAGLARGGTATRSAPRRLGIHPHGCRNWNGEVRSPARPR